MNGYEEARKIDAQIAEILKEHSITKENSREWRNFIRTVRTTFDILEESYPYDLVLRVRTKK